METLPIQSVPRSSAALKASLLTALLSAALTVGGLLIPDILYRLEPARQTFTTNDIISLLINLPALAACLLLAMRGNLLAWLLLPGSILVILYNAAAYLFTLPFPWPSALYLALALLGVTALRFWFTSLDLEAVHRLLRSAITYKLAGGVLAIFGALFFIMQVGALMRMAPLGQPVSPELGTAMADLIAAPLWIFGGIMLWRRHALGSAVGMGLLFQGCMLFIGLLGYLLLQPMSAGIPFSVEHFLVVAGMGLVFFIPFGVSWFRILRLRHKITGARPRSQS